MDMEMENGRFAQLSIWVGVRITVLAMVVRF